MSKLLEFVRALITPDALSRNRDEAYLAEAVDNYDLERRMRFIDRGQRAG